MKLTDFIKYIFYSFYSRDFYKKIAIEWKSVTIVFFLIINFIYVAPDQIIIFYKIYLIDTDKIRESINNPSQDVELNNISSFIKNIIVQLPVIVIENSQISVEQDTLIKDQETNANLIAIKTNASQNNIDQALVVVTKDKFIFNYGNSNKLEYYIIDIVSPDAIYKLNPDNILDLLSSLRMLVLIILPIFIVPILALFNAMYFLIKSLLYSMFAIIILRLNKITIPKLIVFKLALIANVPVMMIQLVVFSLVIRFFKFSIPEFISTIIAIGYFYFALTSCLIQGDSND